MTVALELVKHIVEVPNGPFLEKKMSYFITFTLKTTLNLIFIFCYNMILFLICLEGTQKILCQQPCIIFLSVFYAYLIWTRVSQLCVA